MSNAAAEAETEPVTGAEGLVPVPGKGASLLDRWVEGDAERAIERVNTRVKMLEHLRVASIRATYPTDWIVHVTKDENGAVMREVCYLQDCGADRAAKIWGIEVGNPAIEREDFPDGTLAYHMIAEAWSKVTGERLDFVEGSRWSGDPFFQRQVKRDGDRIDPIDVRKAAYTNLHGRAVRALSGLNGVPLEMLRTAGLDVAKAVHIAYGGGTSGASVGTAEVRIAWGNAKGKKLDELEEKDLAYYLKRYGEDLADSAKEKWKKANQRMVDALNAEQERRTRAKEQTAETGTAAPADRGAKLNALQKRLADALGKGNQRALPVLLRMLTKEFDFERESLSDCSDADLGRIEAIPADELKVAATEAVKGASQ